MNIYKILWKIVFFNCWKIEKGERERKREGGKKEGRKEGRKDKSGLGF